MDRIEGATSSKIREWTPEKSNGSIYIDKAQKRRLQFAGVLSDNPFWIEGQPLVRRAQGGDGGVEKDGSGERRPRGGFLHLP